MYKKNFSPFLLMSPSKSLNKKSFLSVLSPFIIHKLKEMSVCKECGIFSSPYFSTWKPQDLRALTYKKVFILHSSWYRHEKIFIHAHTHTHTQQKYVKKPEPLLRGCEKILMTFFCSQSKKEIQESNGNPKRQKSFTQFSAIVCHYNSWDSFYKARCELMMKKFMPRIQAENYSFYAFSHPCGEEVVILMEVDVPRETFFSEDIFWIFINCESDVDGCWMVLYSILMSIFLGILRKILRKVSWCRIVSICRMEFPVDVWIFCK